MYENLLYIFFVGDIHGIGGAELYMKRMVKWLKRNGASVAIVHSGVPFGKSDINELTEYISLGNRAFGLYLPEQLSYEVLNSIYERVYSLINEKIVRSNRIVIESDCDNMALWGEYFAKRLGAIHVVHALAENYRSSGTHYLDHMDFFKYKFFRGEIYGGVKKLFEDELTILNEEDYSTWDTEEYPIADKEFNLIERRSICDCTITYIGRLEKPYVPNLVHEVGGFALSHPDMEIEFLIVGDYLGHGDFLCEELASIRNLKLTLCGKLVPIPRSLLLDSDVIIANSQTAIFCSYEGIPVVVMDSRSKKAIGILGYDCGYDESVNIKAGKETQELSGVLEKLLVKKIELHLPEKRIINTNEEDYSSWERMMGRIENHSHDYYDVCKSKEEFPSKIVLHNTISGTFNESKMKEGIIVFCAGIKGKECCRWAKKNNITIYAVVDNNVEKIGAYFEGHYVEKIDILLLSDNPIVISDERFTDEIKEQLLDFGVMEERIITFGDLIRYPM